MSSTSWALPREAYLVRHTSDTPGEITSASKSLRLVCPGLGPQK